MSAARQISPISEGATARSDMYFDWGNPQSGHGTSESNWLATSVLTGPVEHKAIVLALTLQHILYQ